MVNYYQLHYHMKNCGVRIVIDNIFKCLKEFTDYKSFLIYSQIKSQYQSDKIITIDIPPIDYNDDKYDSFEELNEKSKQIALEILSKMDLSDKCVIHAHNVNLMKNTCLGRALQIIADSNPEIKLIMQVHDFAEDNRPKLLEKMQNSTGQFNSEIGVKLAYPTGKNITYCTINSRDKKLLEKTGISDVHLFSNNINCELFKSEPHQEGLLEMIEEFAQKNNYFFEKNRKILLSPLKIIKRKNIIETLFILKKLNEIKDEWQLLISLDANSPEDILYSDKIKSFIKKNKMPVVIGFGFDFISPGEERDTQFPYNLRDLFEISNVIITTSIKEGFGMSYLEGWISKKPVVGRRLNYIFKDFENVGLDLNHFYNKIEIEGKDFKDYSEDEQFSIIEMNPDISKKKDFSKFIKFILNPDMKIITYNRKIILKEYSLKSYFKKIKEMIKAEGRRETIDNLYIIKYFENENNNNN